MQVCDGTGGIDAPIMNADHFGPMGGVQPVTISTALSGLTVEDPVAGDLALPALVTLSDGEPLDTLSTSLNQRILQYFLWRELPMWWWAGRAGHTATAEALSRVLSAAGLQRYARICIQPETRQVIDAYERGPAEGLRAFLDAQRQSGIDPPDVPDLAWSGSPGPAEITARWSIADLLEIAMAAEGPQPDRAGGGQAHRGDLLVRSHLTRSRPELGGRSHLQAIMTERVSAWHDRMRGPDRRALADRVGRHLLSPIPPPAGWSELVAAAQDPGARTNGASHEQRRAISWLMSRTGAASRAYPQGGWSALAQAVLPADPLAALVTETALLLLLASSGTNPRAGRLIWEGVSQEMSQPVTARSLSAGARRELGQLVASGRTLGLVRWSTNQPVALTQVGRLLGLEALRLRAVAPQPDPRLAGFSRHAVRPPRPDR